LFQVRHLSGKDHEANRPPPQALAVKHC